MNKYKCKVTKTIEVEVIVSGVDAKDACKFIAELNSNEHLPQGDIKSAAIKVTDVQKITEDEDDFYNDNDIWCCYYCKHRPPKDIQNVGKFDCPRRPQSCGDLNSRDYYDCWEAAEEAKLITVRDFIKIFDGDVDIYDNYSEDSVLHTAEAVSSRSHMRVKNILPPP